MGIRIKKRPKKLTHKKHFRCTILRLNRGQIRFQIKLTPWILWMERVRYSVSPFNISVLINGSHFSTLVTLNMSCSRDFRIENLGRQSRHFIGLIGSTVALVTGPRKRPHSGSTLRTKTETRGSLKRAAESRSPGKHVSNKAAKAKLAL